MSRTLTLNSEKSEATVESVEALAPEAAAPDVAEVAAPEAPALAPAAPAVDYAALLGKKVWVQTVYGNMVNLFTSEVYTSEAKRVKVDQFVVNQLAAGKMALYIEQE